MFNNYHIPSSKNKSKHNIVLVGKKGNDSLQKNIKKLEVILKNKTNKWGDEEGYEMH